MEKEKQKEKEIHFNQKQKAKEVGAECWEKGENEERQQKLQEKSQHLKQDQEHQ